MMTAYNPLAWERDFPPVLSHTSISFLKRQPGFTAAKGGDMQAAGEVVSACVKRRRIEALREEYPSSVLLPVISENKLPQAYAQVIGLEVDVGVYIRRPVTRKVMSCAQRLLHKPDFAGAIAEGRSYIIVDDIVSKGGTVSALRKYVLDRGGSVCAVAALAHSASCGALTPTSQSISNLSEKFDCEHLSNILKEYRVADDLRELTYPEIKYLLRFKQAGSIERLLNKCERPDSFY